MAAGYYELVIDGDEKVARVFLIGFTLGRKIETGIFFCKDHSISSHHLKDIIHIHDRVHVISKAAVKGAIVSALKKTSEEMHMKLSSVRPLKGATFSFKFDTFNRKVAGELKSIFKRPPAGIRLVEFEPSEDISPEAKGVEGYAPLHDYHYHGHGQVFGGVEKLIRYHEKMDAHEFIDTKDIHLVFLE